MGESKKARLPASEEELGLWLDTRIINKHLKQPSQSMFTQRALAPAERLLHFADLALGSIGPDKFRVEKVSKKRK